MKNPAKWLARRLPLVFLLVILALLRVERGVAELKGTAGEPSRLLRLSPVAGIETWAVTVLGHEREFSVDVEQLKELARGVGDRVKDALPQ